MCLLTLAIFFMVYKLTFTGQGYAVPLLSMVLLGVEVSFAWRTLEVRPDQIVILSWLLGAWLLVRSPEPISRRAYGWSGLSAGMGLLFSPKAFLRSLLWGERCFCSRH
jgi:4-amino-4-deoxy-L-arabinose transferase-like glycosyltransferase